MRWVVVLLDEHDRAVKAVTDDARPVHTGSGGFADIVWEAAEIRDERQERVGVALGRQPGSSGGPCEPGK